MDDIVEVVEEKSEGMESAGGDRFDGDSAPCTGRTVDTSDNGPEHICSTLVDDLKKSDPQEVTNESKRNKDFEALENNINIWRKKFTTTKENIEEEIRNVDSTKIHVIKDIKRYKKELVLKLDELEKQSIDLVNERCRKITDEMQALVCKINDIMNQADKILAQVKTENEANASKGMKHVKYMREELSNVVSSVQGFEGLSIRFDKGIDRYLDGLTGLAKVNLPCQTKLTRQVDIKLESDIETCGVSDMCLLSDGTLVMTDLSNDSVKRLDQSYGKKDFLQLDGGPLGICATRSGEMAVTLREGKAVQFLKYTSTGMTLAKSFKTDCSCNYIGYMNDVLFVTCEGEEGDGGQGHIRKYDLNGKLLQVIETDDRGNKLFSTPLHITVSSDKTKLFITDMDNKMIIVDDTKKLNRFRHVPLAHAFGILALPNQNIFVSSVETHTVCQFDDRGRFVGTILNKSSGLVNPVCLAYNKFRRQIIISMDDADVLLILNSEGKQEVVDVNENMIKSLKECRADVVS